MPVSVPRHPSLPRSLRSTRRPCTTPHAGILHNPATGLAPETALARVTLAGLLENFQTNAAGHILALKHMAPLLAAAARANGATA